MPSLLAALAIPFAVSSCATTTPEAGSGGSVEEIRVHGTYVAHVPDLGRHERKDSVAAVGVLARFWGREAVQYPAGAGGNDFDLYPVDEAIQAQLIEADLWSFAFYGTIRQLEQRLALGIPVLVIVQDNAMNIGTRRFMIVVGVNEETRQVLVHEGGPSPGVYSYRHFNKIWWPVRNWMMVICPPDRVAWEMRMLEYVALARYQEKKGDWDRALRDYRRAIEVDPDSLPLKLAMADALYNSGDTLGALALYRTVLDRNELSARAANNLAYVLADTNGDLAEAERLVRRALTIEPSNPIYLDTLGFVLIKAGRHREAAMALSRAEQRMDAMPVEAQREIVTRLISAFDGSNQSHLSRQILEAYQLKDPGFDPGEPTRPPPGGSEPEREP